MAARAVRHEVTPDDLRTLATVDTRSLFRDATALIDSDEGIIQVPLRVVEAALAGQSRLQTCRLLYTRSQFQDDGIITGKVPRTMDPGRSLDERLADITEGINSIPFENLTGMFGGSPDPGKEAPATKAEAVLPAAAAPEEPGAIAGGPVLPSGPPVIIWDVDDVLSPAEPGAGHVPFTYDGPGPDGSPATGTVYLAPAHGEWIRELTEAGASHAWATSWGDLARTWIAPRLGYPAAGDWPVIETGFAHSNEFGWTSKFRPVSAWLGDRPVFWIDDFFAGKEQGWAEGRTRSGIPTQICHVRSPGGLSRSDVDAALAWLAAVRAAGTQGRPARRPERPRSRPPRRLTPPCRGDVPCRAAPGS